MELFRNPEIKIQCIIQGMVSLIATCLFYFWQGALPALAVFFLCLLFVCLQLFSNKKRYNNIAILSQQLDRILHDNHASLLTNCTEGELAILHSQLTKMILQLREQADSMHGDKVLLANALADISHQMKTPLTSIHLLLSFLNEEEVTKKRRREISREISSLLDRIDWLVYALLKMSRLDAGTANMEKRTVSVKELLQKSYDLLAIPMDIRGVTWKADAASHITFTGDLSWSIEAISNIIKNCMESCPEGGLVQATATQNTLFTQIVITDNGPGIAEKDLPHLFERFYRGDSQKENSVGIGLSLAQKIITSQNGTIQVKNRPECGALFSIRFYHAII